MFGFTLKSRNAARKCYQTLLIQNRIDMKLHLFILTILVFAVTRISAQIQLGTDIDGEAAYDISGNSVSLSSDGSRVLIGARNNDGNGSNAGHVRIYEWSSSNWIQLGNDIDGESADDWSGLSTSISSDGNRVAIGAYRNDGVGTNAGHVRIYEWSGSNWIQLGDDIDGEAAENYSGQSISLSSDGERIAIGAIGNDGNGSDAGHTRIFEWSGNNWMQLGDDIQGESAGDYCGHSTSMSWDGRLVAIGATHNDENGTDAGHVRIYEWSGSMWQQLGNDIDGVSTGEYTGFSTSISSDASRVAVGAYQNAENGTYSGQVRVYYWSGSNWTQLGGNINGEAPGDFSGQTVSMSSDGNIIAIGAPQNNGNGSFAGHVRIYKWSGVSWMQIGTDIDGESANNYSGHSISLSSDGSHIAIGAPLNDDNGIDAGHVRVYSLDDLINLTEQNKIKKTSIYVSPNPTKGAVTLHLPETISNVTIQVTDLKGTLISTNDYNNVSEPQLNLNAPSGIYFIKVIIDSNEVTVLKLIKN